MFNSYVVFFPIGIMSLHVTPVRPEAQQSTFGPLGWPSWSQMRHLVQRARTARLGMVLSISLWGLPSGNDKHFANLNMAI